MFGATDLTFNLSFIELDGSNMFGLLFLTAFPAFLSLNFAFLKKTKNSDMFVLRLPF